MDYRRELRERALFLRLSRAQIADKMRPLGFDFDPEDTEWTKRDALDEYIAWVAEHAEWTEEAER